MPLTNTASAHSKSSLVAGPMRGQIGRDQQQPLRRHESLNAVGQGIGVLERAERRRIAGKDAQDTPRRFNALSSHQISSATSSNNYTNTN
jgi:hypothetical protein